MLTANVLSDLIYFNVSACIRLASKALREMQAFYESANVKYGLAEAVTY